MDGTAEGLLDGHSLKIVGLSVGALLGLPVGLVGDEVKIRVGVIVFSSKTRRTILLAWRRMVVVNFLSSFV